MSDEATQLTLLGGLVLLIIVIMLCTYIQSHYYQQTDRPAGPGRWWDWTP
jgi:hypothetical protein